jgi:guanylate kinase
MKSNISKKEIESGKDVIKLLGEKNPKLLPHHLKEVIPEYQKFSPHPHKYGLWSSTKTKHKKFNQKYDKILLLFSGITAGGKDALYQEMARLSPNLFKKTVTNTSRPPREGEVHGVDYYFFDSAKSLRQAIKNGEFIESIQRGTQLYGLSKKSLDDAIQHPNPVIFSQIEMSGWSKAEKYITQKTDTKIFTLKIFVLPDMNFSEYKNWLIQKRTNDDLDSRLAKTGWEIKKAPKKADFIVTNRIRENSPTLTYTAQAIINQILDFLPDLPGTSKFDLPFEIKGELSNIESILTFHDSIK